MVRMRVRPEGFKRLRTLNEALRLSDGDRQTVVLRLLDSVHNRQVRKAFTTQGASTGRPWAPWSPGYAAWRKRHGLGRRIMRLTDTLYEKATSPFHGGHVAQWLGGLRYSFGFADEPGYLHMNAEAPRGRLPLRSALLKTQADHRELVSAFADFWRARVRQVLRNA